MLRELQVMISLDEYQCENEKKSYNNQIKFQTKTVSSMIIKGT